MSTNHLQQFISSAELRARYGGRSQMWIARRLADPRSGFPRPYRFGDGRFRYWKLSELEAWEQSCAAAPLRKAMTIAERDADATTA
jgi:predicted DNA-binding transcriptional regulator AlpA